MSREDIEPCWINKNCAPTLNNNSACPASEAWLENKYCFEVSGTFCRRAMHAISGKASIADCKKCDYYEYVKNELPEGEAHGRLVEARLRIKAGNLEEFKRQFNSMEDFVDKLMILEQYENTVRNECALEVVKMAKALAFIYAERERIKVENDID